MSQLFTSQCLKKYHSCDEMHVVLDWYDIVDSKGVWTEEARRTRSSSVPRYRHHKHCEDSNDMFAVTYKNYG